MSSLGPQSVDRRNDIETQETMQLHQVPVSQAVSTTVIQTPVCHKGGDGPYSCINMYMLVKQLGNRHKVIFNIKMSKWTSFRFIYLNCKFVFSFSSLLILSSVTFRLRVRQAIWLFKNLFYLTSFGPKDEFLIPNTRLSQ